jgi:hypothetical protein
VCRTTTQEEEMKADNRKEIERVLLAEAVGKRSLEFLTKEGIAPDHFKTRPF